MVNYRTLNKNWISPMHFGRLTSINACTIIVTNSVMAHWRSRYWASDCQMSRHHMTVTAQSDPQRKQTAFITAASCVTLRVVKTSSAPYYKHAAPTIWHCTFEAILYYQKLIKYNKILHDCYHRHTANATTNLYLCRLDPVWNILTVSTTLHLHNMLF